MNTTETAIMNTTETAIMNTTETVYNMENLSSNEASLFYAHILLLDVVLLLMGVCGNALVFYIYQWKLHRTVFTLLVRVLAVLDFLSVSVNIPIGILFKFIFIHPKDHRLCSLYLFVEHFVFCFSGLLFIIIAVQRYRKMCKVFKEQIHLHLARKLILGALCFSAAVSIPLFVSTSGRYIEVPYKNGSLLATTCDYNNEAKKSKLALAGAILFDMEFVVITIILATLYFRISQKYRRHETRARTMSFRKSLATRHMTKIFSLITVFFLVSITPVLVCSSVFSVTGHLKMSYPEFVLFDIGIILPYFHSIINPIIYGVTIRNFRHKCKKLFHLGKFSRRQTSDSSENDANRQAVLLRESS